MVFMLALDGVFTYAVWRSGGRRHDAGVDFWLLFVFLVGPLSYVRFDMIPAVLAGGALLAARTRPWVAGALTGLGAAIKLWPALLIPVLLADKERRKPTAIGFVVVGFGLALISLITGGLTRLFSPLTWQSGRGLQIESIWATPLMLLRMVRPEQWVVEISRYQAYEIFGAGVGLWQTVSNVATVLGLVTIVVLWVRAYRMPGGVTPVAVALVVLATVTVVIITNKTLSPQYLLWIGGPIAALLLLRDGATPDLRRWIVRIGVARTRARGADPAGLPAAVRRLPRLHQPRGSGDRHPGDRRPQRVPAGLHGGLPAGVLAGYFIVPCDTEPCS